MGVKMKAMLLASAIVLAAVNSASADTECFRLVNKDWAGIKDHEVACIGFDPENGYSPDLTPTEEIAIAKIIAGAERREAAEAEKEQAAENARRAKCWIPLVWIGCPARNAEAKR
jgi:hypothetical protein